MIKSRRISLAEHVARMGRAVVYKGFWWGNLTERDNSEDSAEEGRITLT
jgi:hypothetical protein